MTDKEIQSILDELNSVRPEKLNGKARKLFDKIMQILDERDDIKAELQATEERNYSLGLDFIQIGEKLGLENFGTQTILLGIEKLQKVIEEMAEQLSKRPIMIFEKEFIVLDGPKEIIKYFTKKVEEENEL